MKKSVREAFKNNRLRSRYEVKTEMVQGKLSLVRPILREKANEMELLYRASYKRCIDSAKDLPDSEKRTKLLNEAQHWQDLYLYEEEKRLESI